MPTAPTFTPFGPQAGPIPLSQLDGNFDSAYDSLRNWNAYSLYAEDTGAANAYVCATGDCITATLAEPLMLWFKAANANTGASTLNFGGTGATAIKFPNGNDLTNGFIQAGDIVGVAFNGTHWVLISGAGIGLTQWYAFRLYAPDADTEVDTGIEDYTVTTGGEKVLQVKASVSTVSSSGTPTFDINLAGTGSILGNKIVIAVGQHDSTQGGSTQPTITTATLPAAGYVTFDCDVAGTDTTGGVVYMQIRKG